MAIQLDDQVLRPQARCCRGGSLDDLNDFDAGLAPELSREARGQRPGSAREAEVGAAKAALRHQRADDLAGRLVDGHRQPEPDARDCGVDADHAAGAVREGAARVAGVERGIGLDHVVDDAPALGRQRPAECGDHAGGDRAREAVRVADCDHQLADAEALCVAELGGGQVLRVGPEDGKVGVRVGTDDLEAVLASVDEGRPAAAVASGDDVGGREQEAVGRDHDRATAAV